MKKWMKAALCLPPAAAGLCLAGSYGLYRRIFRSPDDEQNDDYAPPAAGQPDSALVRTLAMIDGLNARPCEKVSIESFDGLRLSGRYYHIRDGAPVAVMLHGYRGTPSRDFCGGARLCFDLGCNVLLAEQRAHCSSEGHTISLGVNERQDCLSWCRYAAGRFHAPILLVGISMGAATVLMASAMDLPENVRGIVADCPYTSPEAILRHVAAERHYPVSAVLLLARLGARLYGGFALNDETADAAEAVRHTRVPVLLIHGESDAFVPCGMSREIAAANQELVELHTFPGAWHGGSYLVNPDRYTRIVSEFAERVLKD